MLVGAACRMQQVILANHRSVGIREDGKRVPGFVGKVARNLRRIDADRYGEYPGRLELSQPFLDAS